MDFNLTPVQKMVQTEVNRFAREFLEPRAQSLDKVDGAIIQHPEILSTMASMNLFGIQISEKYGGAALDSISYVLTIEELSKACASTGLMTTVHNSVAAAPIEQFGTEDQIDMYLYSLASGQKIGSFSITEPYAGSDAGSMQTTAVKDGTDYLLNGTKCFVTNGGISDIFLIGASLDRKLSHRGIAIFLVEKGTEGFSIGKMENKIGMRGNPVTDLILENVRVPKENILGGVKGGFQTMMKTLDMGRIGIAAQALGIGMAAYEAAAKYSLERKQFGKAIGSFQAMNFRLAEMKTRMESARYLIYRAADLKDNHYPYSEATAMCKYWASENAMRVCTDAMQIFGGSCIVQELPVQRYFRDCKITEIYEGTSEVMKMIIGGNILKQFKSF
jgi:butyryl-CoA dehydrogenase